MEHLRPYLIQAAADVFRAAYKEDDLSQAELSKRTGLYTTVVQRYMAGTRAMGLEAVDQFSDALGLDPLEMYARIYTRARKLEALSAAQATNVVKFEKRPQDMTGAELDSLTIDKAAVEYNDESTEPEDD